MAEHEFRQTDAYRCGCPGCGGAMRYDIRLKGMICDNCGQNRLMSDVTGNDVQKEDDLLDVVVYTCPSCGATLNASQWSATNYCSYCGSDVVLTARLDRIRRPKEIMPFRITREECESIYRKHIGEARFAPRTLNEQTTIDHFRPVYIPYWRYTFRAEGEETGYGTRKYSDSSYNYTDEYQYDVNGMIEVSGAVFDASTAFDDDTAQQLGFRYRAREARPFHPAYLCGIYTETPDVGDVVYRQEIQRAAEEAFESAVNLKSGTDGHCRLPKERRTETDLVLLPVWLLANRQGERVLYTAINGLDGTIVCDPPVSNKRSALVTAGLFCVILAVLLLLRNVIILRPNLILGISGLLAAIGLRWIVGQTDEILVRRASDPDPTRSMKRIHRSEDIALSDPLKSVKGKEKSKISEMLSSNKKQIGCAVLIIAIVMIPVIAAVMNSSRAISALISDRGFGVPILLIVATILLFTKNYVYRSVHVDEGRSLSGPGDLYMLYLMRCLMIAGVVVTVLPVPGVGYWCYGISIAILLLFSLNMIRLNGLYNEYVTRPVPFFGEEVKQ